MSAAAAENVTLRSRRGMMTEMKDNLKEQLYVDKELPDSLNPQHLIL